MSSIPDHPGYLGFTSQGVIAIHADWPAYPVEHGWWVALETLGQFPRGCALRQIDDIDQCYLLVLGDPQQLTDVFDSKLLHAAVWREDLFALHRRGLVAGCYEISLKEWVERRRKEVSGRFWIDSSGVPHPIPLPTIEEFWDGDDSDGEPPRELMVSRAGISVSDTGWSVLEARLAAQREKLHASLRLRSLPIVALGQFDTAVREACLLLETRLRHIVGSQSFGQDLVGEFDAKLHSTKSFIPAQLKTFILDIRTSFKYVRNEYMHGLHELTSVQCYALLARVSRILIMLDEVEQNLSE